MDNKVYAKMREIYKEFFPVNNISRFCEELGKDISSFYDLNGVNFTGKEGEICGIRFGKNFANPFMVLSENYLRDRIFSCAKKEEVSCLEGMVSFEGKKYNPLIYIGEGIHDDVSIYFMESFSDKLEEAFNTAFGVKK